MGEANADTATTSRFGSSRMIVGVAGVIFACLTYLALHVLPVTTSPGFSWHNFRQYFPYDQYSYLAIAVDVQHGNLAAVEPFTEMGSNYYPRLYYIFLGLVARFMHLDIVLVWQVVGIGVQLGMVVAISVLIIRFTGVPAMGALGFLPSIIGTFATLTDGDWYHKLDNHGVLWGAFGVLFTLNGESAALAVSVTALCVLAVTFVAPSGRRSVSPRARLVGSVIAAVSIGLLANVQTYSFLTTVYIVVYIVAVFGLLEYGNWKWWLVSGALLAFAVGGGHAVASSAGPLITLMSALAGALPGFFLVFARHRLLVGAGCLGLALAASPTIAATLVGVASKDSFLTYRELSSEGLGVPFSAGVLAALVPLLLVALLVWVGMRDRRRSWIAFGIGGIGAWSLAATNDLWGANQEPYRLWIDGFVLITSLALPGVFGLAAGEWRARRNRPRDTARTAGHRALVPLITVLVPVVAIAVSLADYSGFSRYVHDYGTASFSDQRTQAVRAVTAPLSTADSPNFLSLSRDGRASGLVFYDPCISPFVLKTATGLPTAFYNRGLAWPNDEPTMKALLDQRGRGAFDRELALRAGVHYVLTDSVCAQNWAAAISGKKVQESPYTYTGGNAFMTLWDIRP